MSPELERLHLRDKLATDLMASAAGRARPNCHRGFCEADSVIDRESALRMADELIHLGWTRTNT